MSAAAGRNLIVKRGDVAIAGIRTKTVAFDGEMIDITNDDDDGWRSLLANTPTVQGVTITCEGVTKNNLLRGAKLNRTTLDDMAIEWPDGDTIAGDFELTAYSETGATEDAITFSATFASSGIIVYTAAAT